MRLMTFINFYLSPIQAGIQTAHIVHELFNKYPVDFGSNSASGMLHDWSQKHKTIIVLNAGVDANIQELMDVFAKYEFPFTQFVEDEGLCNARTGCGIVLPEWIYSAERKFDKDTKEVYYEFMNLEIDEPIVNVFREDNKYFDLIDLIKSKRLA